MTLKSDIINKEQAQQMWKDAEARYNAGDVDAFLAYIPEHFTADAVVRFADFPEMRGVEEISKFMKARFARQKNYRLKKTFKSVADNILGGLWDGEWVDAKTGKKMQGRGAEFVKYVNGKVAEWDCVFNIWEKGVPHQLEII